MTRKFFTVYRGFVTARGDVAHGFSCTCGEEVWAGDAGSESAFRAQHMQSHFIAGDAARLGGEVVRGCPDCGELSNAKWWGAGCEKAWKDAYEAVSQPA